MDQGHLPSQCNCLGVPLRENGQNGLIHRLIITILVHVIGVNWANRVVSSKLLTNDEVESFVIAVTFCLNEVLKETQIADLHFKVIECIEEVA